MFSGKALEANRVKQIGAGESHARRLIGCGPPVPDTEIAIVDPTTCRPKRAGRGRGLGAGTWRGTGLLESAERNRAALSCEKDGEDTHICAREISVSCTKRAVRHRKAERVGHSRRPQFFPDEIERAVASAHATLKPDAGVAFSVEVDHQERLVVVQEARRSKRFSMDEILLAIRRELAEQYDISPYAVVLVPGGSLPKTSSGKLRRLACRKSFLAESCARSPSGVRRVAVSQGRQKAKIRPKTRWRPSSRGSGGGAGR